MNSLFSQAQVDRQSKVMASMTRSRSDDAEVPSDRDLTYYAKRCSGLIISEGAFPTARSGYVLTPGIESPEQAAAWKQVTEAVNARGGRTFIQLMHCGRFAHPSLLPEGVQPQAPSAIKAAGQTWITSGLQGLVTPHAMSVAEIASAIDSCRPPCVLAYLPIGAGRCLQGNQRGAFGALEPR